MNKDIKNKIDLKKFLENSEQKLKAQCAIDLVLSKLQIIDSELSFAGGHKVVVNMQSRIKTTESVVEKMKKKKIPLTMQALTDTISDLVGVRAVCAFEDDIYKVAEILLAHPDVELLKKKDYIKSPKKSGYRSLHLIIQVPVYFSTGAQWVKVELQLRTSAMNFWADLDHQMRYKKGAKEAELIGKELKDYAVKIQKLDKDMVRMRKKIETL